MSAFVHERAVRFADVDAAGILYFPRFFDYCHEAMEAFFAGLDGGYVGLVSGRRIGLPAVHASADFKAPLRWGDVARIAVTALEIGNSSARLRYVLSRASDGVESAVVQHVVVATSLDTMTKQPLPDDVRAALTRHRA